MRAEIRRNPTSTAARPTKLCKIATSSGIEVICTRLAKIAPITSPGTNAAIKTGSPPTFIAAPVATNAITIPMIPYQFPRRAVSCRLRPPRLKINNALAAMYAIVIRLVIIQLEMKVQEKKRDRLQ